MPHASRSSALRYRPCSSAARSNSAWSFKVNRRMAWLSQSFLGGEVAPAAAVLECGAGDAAAFDLGRKHDTGFGALDAFDRAQRTDQGLERLRVARLGFEQQRVAAGDVMTLEHVVQMRQLLLEVRDALGMTDRHADEGGDVHTQAPRIDLRVVPGDEAFGLELAHALYDRRCGQSDLLAHLGQRGLTVGLQ